MKPCLLPGQLIHFKPCTVEIKNPDGSVYRKSGVKAIAAKEDDFADFRAGKRGLLHHFVFNVGVRIVRDSLVFGLDSAGCRQYYPKQPRFIVCLLERERK